MTHRFYVRQWGFALGIAWITASAALAMPAQFGASPDNSLPLLLQTIGEAEHALTVNIYHLERPAVVQALKDALGRGVKLKILIEAQTFLQDNRKGMTPGAWTAAHDLLEAIQAAPQSRSHLYLMRAWKYSDRRFVFNHAKYVVADGSKVFISSENFTNTGLPDPGTRGNRGWQIVLEDAVLAQALEKLFQEDANTSLPDVDEPREIKIPEQMSESAPRETVRRTLRKKAPLATQVESATLLYAPHSAPRLIAEAEQARKSIDVEQMSMPLEWRSPHIHLNPVVASWVAAARRGVKVRVLLNDEHVFDAANEPARADEKLGNVKTARALMEVAECDRLPIQAKIVDVKALQITYIHNKGLIFDRNRVVVSSINGTQNSMERNREVGVVVQSADAGSYYGGLFDSDWKKSPALVQPPIDCAHPSEGAQFLRQALPPAKP